MKKNIVIFSNPFGYGPTGKAIAIAEAFRTKNVANIIFAGSSFVREIVPGGIECLSVNERDDHEISEVLKKIENPYVVSSQNRFSVRGAKVLGLPTAFLDGLAWFWKEIPADHLVADEIFWMRYPHIQNKIPSGTKNIHLVGAVIDSKEKDPNASQTLIHLGGCKNPFVETLPKMYLDILAEALSALNPSENIKIVGGAEAVGYLRKLGVPFKVVSLKHDDFIHELSNTLHFITTAGQTATLEAFALGIPVSFLLPMNLSQLALTEVLSECNASDSQLEWSSYVEGANDLSSLTEREAIAKLSEYAGILKDDDKKRRAYQEDFLSMLERRPDNRGQQNFIKSVGVNGKEEIVDALIEKWDL